MKRYAAFALLLIATIARADKFDTWFEASPDKKLVAVERRIPDPHQQSRLDLDSLVVFICAANSSGPSAVPMQGPVIAQHTFEGRVISQIGWSPDSQFLLFTTTSSGGHSPWHFKTYAFCVADKSFRDVEAAMQTTIGAGKFKFESPDVVALTVNIVPAESVKKTKLSLSKAIRQMERLP